MLEQLSLEILLNIFALACTDNCKTGCALSAVSRRIRCISAPYRFQFVAVASAYKLYALWDALRTLSLPHPRYRIRRLYVGRIIDDLTSFYHPTMDITLDDTIRDLLFWAAPDLEVLCFFHDGTHLDSEGNDPLLNTVAYLLRMRSTTMLSGLDFPCLREFTILGSPSLTLPFHNVHFAPRLQRLHISYEILTSTGQGHEILSVFPHLTQLHISHIRPMGFDAFFFLYSLLSVVMGRDPPLVYS